MTSRNEKVYVLFGSQTGNSEDYARTFAEEIPTKLSPDEIQKLTGTSDTITLQPKAMQLDDFLEINKADWTRLVVIFVSSYGVGQAPLGCYRFRDLCDAWKERQTPASLLEGVQYALCGLGDSSYTTFFENPTTLDKALTQVGAKRIGTLGKADAQGTGDAAQAPVIERWKETMWKSLAEAVVTEPPSEEALKAMQDKTVELCIQINPEFEAPAAAGASESKDGSSSNTLFMIVPVIMAVLAILAYFVLQNDNQQSAE